MPIEETKAFLRAILPVEGLKCAVVLGNGAPRQTFYETTDELAEAVLRLDQALEGTKAAVYHGCASYKSRGRKASDVLVARSFWLDVDAGEGKPYPDGRTAAGAVLAFAGRARLPVPLLVNSGGGVHAYWPLDESLSVPEWVRYASAFKRCVDEHGLQADRVRTADIASILRPHLTHNRKHDQALQVRAGPEVGPYSLADFASLHIEVRRDSLRSSNYRSSIPDISARSASPLFARLATLDTPQVVDFDLLTARCAQMRNLRESAGKLEEPLWHATLGVLAKVAGGKQRAHEWSSGDPRYSRAETQAKLDRARSLTGPPSCAHFGSIEPARCAACAFRATATTPLDVLTAAVPGNSFEAEQPADKPYSDFSIFSYQTDGSLCIKTETNDGKMLLRKLTSFPLYFQSVHTGELKTSSFTYSLQHWLPQEGWKTVEMPARVIFGQQGISLLAEAGVVVHDAEGFRKFARESIDMLNVTERLKVQYEQFGWKDGEQAFLYGDRLYGATSTSVVAGSPEVRLRSQWLQPRAGGSLASWKDAAERLFGRGSEGQSFTVLASFAAPLMRFLEDEEGGAIVSLVTRDSGTGKTTSLAGAYTVWSQAARGLSLTTIDTRVSKGLTLATLGNLPVIYDEFQSRDPDEVHDMIMMFTNGRDKMRGTQDGQIQHTAASWQTILFTASNASLVNAIQASGRSEAPGYRVLEFPIQSQGEMTPIDAGRLKKQMELNAGHAGDAFLRYLVKPETLAWVRQKLPALANEIYRQGGFRKEHRFWVRTLAAVGTASLIVKHLGLVSFNPDRIMAWAVDHFERQKASSVFSNASSSMPQLLAQFLNEHIAETLVMPFEFKSGRMPTQVIYQPQRRVSLRRDVDVNRYTVERTAIRDWLAKREITFRDFVAELSEIGVITNANRFATLGAGTSTPGGQVHCLVIDGNHTRLTGVLAPVADTRMGKNNER